MIKIPRVAIVAIALLLAGDVSCHALSPFPDPPPSPSGSELCGGRADMGLPARACKALRTAGCPEGSDERCEYALGIVLRECLVDYHLSCVEHATTRAGVTACTSHIKCGDGGTR